MITSTRTRVAATGVALPAGAVLLLSGCADADRPVAPVGGVAVPGIAPASDAQRLGTDDLDDRFDDDASDRIDDDADDRFDDDASDDDGDDD